MMEVVIVDDGNRLTVYELVERVIPCIIAKHYSENYIQGFRSTFRNLLAYCNKNEKKYFTAELAQQFMQDCKKVRSTTCKSYLSTDAGRIRCAATEMFFFALQIICSALESRITNHFQQIL